jgi:hypothetical protein
MRRKHDGSSIMSCVLCSSSSAAPPFSLVCIDYSTDSGVVASGLMVGIRQRVSGAILATNSVTIDPPTLRSDIAEHGTLERLL